MLVIIRLSRAVETLPISVILQVNGGQVLKILVTTVAVIQKVTFT